jgi:hypothetical protein
VPVVPTEPPKKNDDGSPLDMEEIVKKFKDEEEKKQEIINKLKAQGFKFDLKDDKKGSDWSKLLDNMKKGGAQPQPGAPKVQKADL